MDFEGNPRIGVIELGVVTLSASEIVTTHTRFCRPDGPIPPAESRIHQISQGMVADSEPFAADYQTFVQLRRSGIFAAHNATVEANLLRGQWPSPPLVPDWSCPGQSSADWGPWIDTLKVYRNLYPGLGDYGLQSLIQTFQLNERLQALAEIHCPANRRQPHAALYDSLASALLLDHLWREGTVSPTDSQRLLEWSGLRLDRELW